MAHYSRFLLHDLHPSESRQVASPGHRLRLAVDDIHQRDAAVLDDDRNGMTRHMVTTMRCVCRNMPEPLLQPCGDVRRAPDDLSSGREDRSRQQDTIGLSFGGT